MVTDMSARTIAQVKAANKARGHHFFDRDAMRFFDSRIETRGALIGDRFFVTSEQFHGSDGYSAPRMFTVREAMADGSIETVGEIHGHATRAAAETAVTLALAEALA